MHVRNFLKEIDKNKKEEKRMVGGLKSLTLRSKKLSPYPFGHRTDLVNRAKSLVGIVVVMYGHDLPP